MPAVGASRAEAETDGRFASRSVDIVVIPHIIDIVYMLHVHVHVHVACVGTGGPVRRAMRCGSDITVTVETVRQKA